MIEIRHQDNTQEGYNQIYTGDAIQQMDSYFIWMRGLTGLGPGQKLLDIATGRGRLISIASAAGIHAIGMDFSTTACHEASRQGPGRIVNGDGQALPFADASLDAVTILGSLEHFENMDLAVREIARVVKPAGRVIVSVPNTFGLRWNVQYAWRTGDVDDDGQPLQRYGTRNQWEKILTNNGLVIQRVLGYEHERAFPRTTTDLITYLKHPRRLFSMLLVAPLLPVNMAGQFVFICKPETRNQ